MAAPRRRRDPDPIRITTAPDNPDVDLDFRRRRYIISMLIRTLCFVGAIVVGDNWVRWVLVVGAVFLPYVAVVMANTAASRVDGADLVHPDHQFKELE